ncbi:MAG: nitroreductase [Pseudomonadota bacterium]
MKILPNFPIVDSALPLPAQNQQFIDALTSRRSPKIVDLQNAIAPSSEELSDILKVAIRVPDHGKAVPWRFIAIDGGNRGILGRKLAQILVARGDKMDDAQLELEQTRLERAPLILALVHSPRAHPKATIWEQELSAGALGFSLMLACHGFGYSANWLSEWPIYDNEASAIIGAKPHEKIAGLFYIGKAQIAPTERPRPNLDDIFEYWNDK